MNIKLFLAKNFCSNIYLQAFPAANAIGERRFPQRVFAGIGVLLSASVLHISIFHPILTPMAPRRSKRPALAWTSSLSSYRIAYFFGRLEIYTDIVPTNAMKNVIIEIIVEVLTILAFATKEVKRGRLSELTSHGFTLLD